MMFHFSIRREATKETLEILGQGETVEAAFKDAMKLLGETFRPKNDGRQRPPTSGAVVLPDGARVSKTLKEFEAPVTKPVADDANIFSLDE